MNDARRNWIDYLEEDDLSFLKRFLLFSGSLKDLATAYDVSYPTVRLRLDRLIAKVKVYEDEAITDDFERHLRAASAGGKIDASTHKRLLAAYRKVAREKNEAEPIPVTAARTSSPPHRKSGRAGRSSPPSR